MEPVKAKGNREGLILKLDLKTSFLSFVKTLWLK